MYSTVENVNVTIPYITSVTNITSANVAEFIGRADSIINGYISQLYTVPVSGTVPLLSTLSTDITCYLLLSRRVFTQENRNNSKWVETYKESLSTLKDISAGKILLVDSSGALISKQTATNEVWSNTMDYLPTFHEADILDTIQDPDKITDILTDRDLFIAGGLLK